VPSDEIMLITTGGVLVRTRVSEIREMGRATQGVTLINIDNEDTLSGVRRVAERDVDDDDPAVADAEDAANDGTPPDLDGDVADDSEEAS
jgi:DNA gyrase subunit A